MIFREIPSNANEVQIGDGSLEHQEYTLTLTPYSISNLHLNPDPNRRLPSQPTKPRRKPACVACYSTLSDAPMSLLLWKLWIWCRCARIQKDCVPKPGRGQVRRRASLRHAESTKRHDPFVGRERQAPCRKSRACVRNHKTEQRVKTLGTLPAIQVPVNVVTMLQSTTRGLATHG